MWPSSRVNDVNKLIAGALSAALLIGGATGVALGEDDDDDEGGRAPSGRDLVPVVNERYRTECGGCHFAYQPGLLPGPDWGRIMGSLANHFGDDASLDPAVAQELLNYLTINSADGKGSMRLPAVATPPTPAEAPPRITETAYFTHKHDEIPARLVKGNVKVGSFSNCLACHPGAEKANFNEDAVSIPGAQGWKD